MPRQNINTSGAPQPIGPYVQAVRAGDLLFISGQLPLDPTTGSLVRAGVRAQTRRVIENLKAITEAAGGNLGSLVKVTVYVKMMDDFTQVNEVYAELFAANPPARMVVESSRLPKDAQVAMDAIAYLGN
jgi:2-iminobutanoate/2-iminopropanoate deaminase